MAYDKVGGWFEVTRSWLLETDIATGPFPPPFEDGSRFIWSKDRRKSEAAKESSWIQSTNEKALISGRRFWISLYSKTAQAFFFCCFAALKRQTGNKNKQYDIISLVAFLAEPSAKSRRGRSAEGPCVGCDWAAAAAEAGDPVKRVHQQPLVTVCRCLTLCQSAGTNLWINSAFLSLQALYFLSFLLVSHHLTS